MSAPPLARRLRHALAAELSPRAAAGLDEQLVEHLAAHLAAGGAEDLEAVADSWSPFLVSLGACQDDNGARVVTSRVLSRLRDASGAEAAPAAAATAAAPAAAGEPQPQLAAAPAQEEEELSEEILVWLDKLRLGGYTAKAKAWCSRMGAVHVSEVLEEWTDFADDLKLKPLERKRVEKAAAAGAASADAAGARAAPGAPSDGGSRPSGASAAAQASAPDAAPECAVPVAGHFGPPDDPLRYAILEELGQGATATVYRCRRGRDEYAVKTIGLSKLRLQPGFQRMADTMRREVSILFSLNHPRIVSLYDVCEVPDSSMPEKLHLVMELVHGGELFDKIVERGAFRESVARYVFLQITEGLMYIHSKDIVYRDLKPENILVDEKSSRQDFLEVKLSDFGHSKLINDGYSTALTRVGTPQYWAPEVSDPARAALGYDQTVDLWSLGVVLYVMVIGAYPFDGTGGVPIEEQIRGANVHFRQNALGLEISEHAKTLIRALVQVEPVNRLPLERCISHPWVSREGGSISRLLKLCTQADPRMIEERIPLPTHPTREQVRDVRRDLLEWMKRYHSSAVLKQDVIIAELGDEASVGEDHVARARTELRQIVEFNFSAQATPQEVGKGAARGHGAYLVPQQAPEARKGAGRTFRLLSFTLRVHDEHGAGLDLNPEPGGMRVESVLPLPGQPGLSVNDLITKINEVSLRGTPDRVEEIFGTHFRDGAQIAVRRDFT